MLAGQCVAAIGITARGVGVARQTVVGDGFSLGGYVVFAVFYAVAHVVGDFIEFHHVASYVAFLGLLLE